ncbi:MAG TPA: 16S rRNA (guanine(966)-N(2))-methyltransferase RsmD [Anaerolineales bacterium]|nr:16S rRNA (guanine(966)-N(2))-methyltransferase RsmD [Anaerolineales bacterium]
MRVIGGTAKGFKLKAVPGTGTRPISDRVKESLFNIIGPDIERASFWDLFAGTGSVGIEALSRGASYVRFVDTSNKALAVVKENLKTTRLGNSAEILKGDALALLEERPNKAFEYIYIAPPQYQSLWIRVMERLANQSGWLAEDGWAIVQIHPVEYESLKFGDLVEFDRRKYGSTLLVFYGSASVMTS